MTLLQKDERFCISKRGHTLLGWFLLYEWAKGLIQRTSLRDETRTVCGDPKERDCFSLFGDDGVGVVVVVSCPMTFVVFAIL